MGLNVKISLLICLGFIGGMSWAVSQISQPYVEAPAPWAARDDSADAIGAAPSIQDAQATRRIAPPQVDSAFASPSPFETQAEVNRRSAVTLELTPAKGDPRPEPIALPPLLLARKDVGQATLPPPAEEQVVLNTGNGAGRRQTPAKDRPRQYKVRKGDTLTGIVRRTWDSADAELVALLVSANPQLIGRRDLLRIGEELIIPKRSSSKSAKAAAVRPNVADPQNRRETEKTRWYTIRRHDSLTSIARRELKDSRLWREIAKLNRIRNANMIRAGTRILLPAAVIAASRHEA